MACLRPGMAGPEIDIAGVLALAAAQDVSADVAGALLGHAFAGLRAGATDRKGEG